MTGSVSVVNLEHKIGYHFSDPELLDAALRHRSIGSGHNERLEFLGDSVLGLAVSETLYQRYPDASEGELTRLRARLVRQATLTEVARRIELGSALNLGPSAGRSGGSDRASILADGLEAVLGAIFLDAGFETAKRITLSLLEADIARLEAGPLEKDPKTQLQELLQATGAQLPDYAVISTSGQPHEREFVVDCAIPSLGLITTGQGSSRKAAEQVAALQALRQIREQEASIE
ncbi:MAG: ribonuclease III [Arenicellales bacterium]|nr:ribonuclease III [Arenicellales bacterium]MDP6790368.1 ribonuclease III [Arenicellales bacterium]MDP6918158.1 ribonuclease III [Arenicellales bacterium]